MNKIIFFLNNNSPTISAKTDFVIHYCIDTLNSTNQKQQLL